jgi:hypothetical protein
MPTRDLSHSIVRHALEKDGWKITDDPLHLRIDDDLSFFIDLGAERVLAAERAGEKITVEIKSFVGASAINDFHTALGQYMNYHVALQVSEPERKLFLAVASDVYEVFFVLPFIQQVIERYDMDLIVYQPVTEVIEQWIK